MKLPLYGLIRENLLPELHEISCFTLHNNKILTFNQIADFFIKKMKLNIVDTEGFYLFCMMSDGTPIGVCEIAKGNNDFANVSLNIIGEMLLLTGTNKFLAIHNHPSNDSLPSNPDIEITNRIISLSNFLNITFEEHIIICRSSWNTIIRKRRVII